MQDVKLNRLATLGIKLPIGVSGSTEILLEKAHRDTRATTARAVGGARILQRRSHLAARVERDQERVWVHLGIDQVEEHPDAISGLGREECQDEHGDNPGFE
jgi:hypothetical protein